ncbi:MAG TPA: response regulator [Sphingobium sp.]
MLSDGDEMAGKRRRLGVIAVVDDDSSFREALVASLISLGFLVVEFEAPHTALAALGQLMPACLLLDLDLPVMSGLDLYNVLLGQGFTAPTIFITGNASLGIRAKVLKSGAVACLNKPVVIDELDRLILSVAR